MRKEMLGRKYLTMFLMLVISVFISGKTLIYADGIENKLYIIHTNDTHGRIEYSENEGMGFSKISTIVNEYREKYKNTLLLDAGDTFHGHLFANSQKGGSVARVLDTIRYDALTPGNHDFNYGYSHLLELSKMVNFPIISANVRYDFGERILEPYVIKKMDGLTVGIIGLTTPETVWATNPLNIEGIEFTDPIKEADGIVHQIRDKVDVLIALTHLGLDDASTYTSKRLAKEVDGIDVIVDGHSHTVLESGMTVGNTLIVQTGEYDKNLGIVEITLKNNSVEKKAHLIKKSDVGDIEEDKKVLSIIKEYNDKQANILNEEIGISKVFLNGERESVRTQETNLGDLIADCILKASNGADLAFINGGSIRSSINEGKITKANLLSVIPFDNKIINLKLKGSEIKEMLEQGVKDYPDEWGGFPQVSGVSFKFDPDRKPHERIISIEIGGKPIEYNNYYIMATNDFIVAGGCNFEIFPEERVVGKIDSLVDCIYDYIKAKEVIDVIADGRSMPCKEQIKKSYNEYIVKVGDCLYKIARIFGIPWRDIFNSNSSIKNPNLIFIGQKLMIPVKQ